MKRLIAGAFVAGLSLVPVAANAQETTVSGVVNLDGTATITLVITAPVSATGGLGTGGTLPSEPPATGGSELPAPPVGPDQGLPSTPPQATPPMAPPSYGGPGIWGGSGSLPTPPGYPSTGVPPATPGNELPAPPPDYGTGQPVSPEPTPQQ